MYEGRLVSEKKAKQFKIWLVKNNSNLSKFGKQIGYSRQYISGLMLGKFAITKDIKEAFAKGGFKL